MFWLHATEAAVYTFHVLEKFLFFSNNVLSSHQFNGRVSRCKRAKVTEVEQFRFFRSSREFDCLFFCLWFWKGVLLVKKNCSVCFDEIEESVEVHRNHLKKWWKMIVINKSSLFWSWCHNCWFNTNVLVTCFSYVKDRRMRRRSISRFDRMADVIIIFFSMT